jgi:hypothetical protein
MMQQANQTGWSELDSEIIGFRRELVTGHVAVSRHRLNLVTPVADVVPGLDSLPDPHQVVASAGSVHVGVAVMTEQIEHAESVRAGTCHGRILVDDLDHLLATGQVRQFRAVAGSINDGWCFMVQHHREVTPSDEWITTIAVAEPGEEWPDSPPLVGAVVALDKRLAVPG